MDSDLRLLAELERIQMIEHEVTIQRVRAEVAEESVDVFRAQILNLEHQLGVERERSATAELERSAERTRAELVEDERDTVRQRAEAAEARYLAAQERVESLEQQLRVARAGTASADSKFVAEQARAVAAEALCAIGRARLDTAELQLAIARERIKIAKQEHAAERARGAASSKREEAQREQAVDALRQAAGYRERAISAERTAEVERARAEAARIDCALEHERAQAGLQDAIAWRERAAAAQRQLAFAQAQAEAAEAAGIREREGALASEQQRVLHHEEAVRAQAEAEVALHRAQEAAEQVRVLGERGAATQQLLAAERGRADALAEQLAEAQEAWMRDAAAFSGAATPPHKSDKTLRGWVARAIDVKGRRARAEADRARDCGDWAVAVEQYKRFLHARPDSFAIWVQLGHALKEAGRLDEALTAYETALSLDSQDADLLLQLGHIHKLMGRRTMAIAFYRRSAGQYGNPHASSELDRLGVGTMPDCRDRAVSVAALQSAAKPTAEYSLERTVISAETLNGWLTSLPSEDGRPRRPHFSRAALNQYFRELGLSETPSDAWTTCLTADLSAADRLDMLAMVAPRLGEDYFQSLVERTRRTPVFDVAFYRAQVGLNVAEQSAAIHYLMIGEPMGFKPAADFDPLYYGRRNPDTVAGGLNALLHYSANGLGEGRQPLPPSPPATIHSDRADPQRENIIIVVHETSRTGAPILGWNIAARLAKTYNIYTVRMGDGPLTPEFEALSVEVHGPFNGGRRHSVDVDYGLRPLFYGRTFKYAIVNSVESRVFVEVAAKNFVPTLMLIHEFVSYVRPLDSLTRAYDLATELIFPAPIVAKSSTDAYPALADRQLRIEPQGMSLVPAKVSTAKPSELKQIQALTRAKADGAFIVIGAGSVTLRKGVDLFIAAAADVKRKSIGRKVHFVWIGAGYRPDDDMAYSVYLKEQIDRSGLADHITFIDEVSDLEPFYVLAHVFLLPSRLDPLPNVTIDAAHRGIVCVCFKDASGTADLLLDDPDTAIGVVPHLDSAAAADLICRMANDGALMAKMSHATLRLAGSVFDMERYVSRLDGLGVAGAAKLSQERADTLRRRAFPSIWFHQTWYAEQNGGADTYTFDHFITRGADEGRVPSTVVAFILQHFGGRTPFSLQIYDALVEAAESWRGGVPLDSIWLLTLMYVPQWWGAAATPLDSFIDYLRNGLVAGLSPGPLFDKTVYRRQATSAGLPPLAEDGNPIIHWLAYGIPARIVPTDRFDETYYRRANPDIANSSVWGFAHYIERGVHENRAPNDHPHFHRLAATQENTSMGLPAAYRHWHRLDFPDSASPTGQGIPAKYERRLAQLLASDELAQIFDSARAIEPNVGDLSSITGVYLPPYHQTDGLPQAHAEVRRRLPATHYDSIICVPWVRTGGADRVAGLLAAALLRVRPHERVLILRTDRPHFERASWLPAGADCVDISDLAEGLTPALSESLLRVVFRGLTARRVFNVNSRLCWKTMARFGVNLSATLRTYAYMFCFDHAPSGQRVGYPAEFFSETAGSMTAYLSDTVYLRDELTRMYRLPPRVSARIIPVFTPAQTALSEPSVARRVLERSDPASRRRVLWAGRLDRQKRFDLVQDIARQMPDVAFKCWGEALLDAPPDLSALPANITMMGSFDSFDDLPLTEAGAWLFTGLWEGMPLTIIELATRGVPIVASAVGGVPELISTETGWPVPPDADSCGYAAQLRDALTSPKEAVRRAERLQLRVASVYTEAVYDASLARLLTAEDFA